MSEELDNMIRVKYILDSLCKNDQTCEYAKILKQVDDYVFANCKHEVEKDYIDITPEKSEIIVYCVKCNHTFS